MLSTYSFINIQKILHQHISPASLHPLLLLKCFSAQTLSRTEIERNDVEANSIGIFFVRKGWINRLVIAICEIPDFSFYVTKNYLFIII